jgi:hypothetical protein
MTDNQKQMSAEEKLRHDLADLMVSILYQHSTGEDPYYGVPSDKFYTVAYLIIEKASQFKGAGEWVKASQRPKFEGMFKTAPCRMPGEHSGEYNYGQIVFAHDGYARVNGYRYEMFSAFLDKVEWLKEPPTERGELKNNIKNS